MDQKELLKIIEKAATENATKLNLSGKGITSLPAEIGQLKNLRALYIHSNQLTSVPPEIRECRELRGLDLGRNQLTTVPVELCSLQNLRVLYLYRNQVTTVPPEIGRCQNLKDLRLSANKLSTVPPEISELTNLQVAWLHQNQLSTVPPEIGRLKNLRYLWLNDNQLTTIPAEIGEGERLEELRLSGNQLTTVPREIGRLTNLQILSLRNNQLMTVPREIGQLTNLQRLDLDNNLLRSLPPEIGQLTNLETLHLNANELTSVPREIGQLTNLQRLDLDNNLLRSLPPEIGQLTNLETLHLNANELTSVPPDIGQLENLTQLYLHDNQLTTVPPEIGRLENLEVLALYGNPDLTAPPPEVVKQGTKAILAYLREQLKARKRQWVSKLLVVGEGGVGKTSLLRALRGEQFMEGLETTHGIGLEKLELAHPTAAGVTMEINTWDFGGQQIYHATHQFFLTNRSLFVLVWDARHGWEAGKLYNWLDRIQAKAPDSPVMIVAAHIDERDADLPLDDLQRKYPQIEGHYKISNKKGTRIEDFRLRLGEVAADLPLMGEEWPANWLDAANEIRAKKEHHISPKEMLDVMVRNKVKGRAPTVLAGWLHELGDILYFKDDDELNDTVILNPVWVTEAISDVLESDEVVEGDGILTRANRDELWADVNENVRDHFLRLMERFDLSYRTLEDREISLVVECLPLDPPEYRGRWEAILQTQGCKEISMKFSLSSLPAGIPTWFIARSHRFSTHTHWRLGALFADSKEERHLGLIEAHPHERQLQLTVRGPAPHNFFALLRDGLELTLKRFPGLKIKRTVPCPGHEEVPCAHEFDFGQLEKAIERAKPVMDVQCQEAFENVSVARLLFGLHWSTEGTVISRIDELEEKVVEGQEVILTELRELRELAQREFLRLFNSQQGLEESHCPNVFAVLPKEGGWSEKILGQKMVLQLYCQAPGEWHPVAGGSKGGRYEIRRPAEFCKSMGPYILKLAKVIKYAAPVAGAAAGVVAAGPGGAVMGTVAAKKLAAQIKLMEELAKKLAERDYLEADLLERTGVGGKAERIEGMELRALRALLDKEDPTQEWGGLKKVLTPEGHYLWLCDTHAAEYRK